MNDMINPQEIISAFHGQMGSYGEILENLQASPGVKVFVLGKNEHAKHLLNTISIDGVIDDFSNDDVWQGKRIYRSDALPSGSIVINCSMSISPISAARKIDSIAGIKNIPYCELYRSQDSITPLPDFVYQARSKFIENISEFRNIFSLLEDKESRDVFNKIMSYRLTAELSYMESFSVRFHDQYFEDFLGALDACSFVDCGGFDGDTCEEFIKRYPNYAKIFLFEPSVKNLELAKLRLAGERDIEFIQLGLSDIPGTLSFDESLGSASSISNSGSTQISVTTLDSYQDKFSFIKMDLEGWELKALQGSERHIANDQPILAISVYHSIDDFWRIPQYIMSVNNKYKIYLRHYTEGWSETVMYFLPTI